MQRLLQTTHPLSMRGVGRVCLGMGRVWLAGMVMLWGAACGNWSDDDLIFDRFQVVPEKESLRLKLPGEELFRNTAGSVFGALNDPCEGVAADSLTCGARKLTAVLNQGTAGVIAIVDFVIAKDPSRKESGKRIWGPFFDQATNRTFRFEMAIAGTATARQFVYCLHVTNGRKDGPFGDRGVSCEEEPGGWVQFISGTFTPDTQTPEAPGNVKRHGDGTIKVDFEAVRAANLMRGDNTRGVWDFGYRFDEGTSISIALTHTVDEQTGEPTNGTYSYALHPDGAGNMALVMFKELAGCQQCSGNGALERFEVNAQWTPERASLVVMKASGGDLPAGQVFDGFECTNAELGLVAKHYDWAPMGDLGSASLCPFPPPAN